VSQHLIETVSKDLRLMFWSYDQKTDSFDLRLFSSINANWVISSELLAEHPIIQEISVEFRKELFYLLREAKLNTTSEFFFEYQGLSQGQLVWFLLIGHVQPETGMISGVILPNQTKKQEELEKQALSKVVKNLIVRAEERKREESEVSYEKKLAGREADLVTQTLQANENAERIESIVKTLESKNLDRTSLIKKLRSNVKPEINWEEFKSYFNELHPEFVPSLWNRFPLLTDREIKICILVRLGLRTKEISHLTKLTPKSIEIYRYRIRKKMNLERSEQLIKVLSSSTW
jgi:DNA-binding CsgD family transcriptional regulator